MIFLVLCFALTAFNFYLYLRINKNLREFIRIIDEITEPYSDATDSETSAGARQL